jgi:4a-hydroxytetrahydrobiopterin dehydratase
MTKLNAAQVKSALATVPQWKKRGNTIARTYQFKDFPAAIQFVNGAAGCAEQAWHHPDIDVRWNQVTLTLTTHDAGGLTEKDFALAKKFDALSLRRRRRIGQAGRRRGRDGRRRCPAWRDAR